MRKYSSPVDHCAVPSFCSCFVGLASKQRCSSPRYVPAPRDEVKTQANGGLTLGSGKAGRSLPRLSMGCCTLLVFGKDREMCMKCSRRVFSCFHRPWHVHILLPSSANCFSASTCNFFEMRKRVNACASYKRLQKFVCAAGVAPSMFLWAETRNSRGQ